MFEAMTALAERSVVERVVLLVNHVVRAEPEAMRRLAPHAGKTVSLEVENWPAVLPAPRAVVVRITPPGLVERLERVERVEPAIADADASADLRLRIDAGNPGRLLARWAMGDRPDVAVEGDPALAADLSWLAENLRWDVEEDLSRIVGDAPAHAIADAAGAVARGLRDAAKQVDRAIDGLARGRGATRP